MPKVSAAASAVALIPPELIDAPIVPDLYRLAVDEIRFKQNGLHMEFGVASGRSLRKWRSLLDPSIKLYGFDSFAGIPESWNEFPPGSFATHIRVNLPNTELVVGLYKDTLARFAARHKEPVSLMHIDCDLYSSTKTVLDAFKRNIVNGTIIIFDELFGYTNYQKHEYKALIESGLRFEAIGRWNAYRAAIRVVN